MEHLEYIPIPAELMQIITPEQAWHYRVVPNRAKNGSIDFYADRQVADESLKMELEIVLGKTIHFTLVEAEKISKTLSKYYIKKDDIRSQGKLNLDSEDFVFTLIKEAKELGSSDIHIETYEERCRVRVRVDGNLVERYILKKSEYPTIINKIKIMANLDIAEKRLPQDGRIFFNKDKYKFDIRVSVLPTLYGEKTVMRILSNDATNVDIEKLGFRSNDLSNYLEGVKRPNGILLISGPTGSGKTTTLYATLKLLNKESRNIITIEDPIEYTLEGVNQVQLKESIGLDFASALRTFLRQDPDVIMVGEIRDTATANMAIRASLTGHLVLSTIHTNSAWGTVSRLIDMGVPPFLLANTLNTTVAQRLVKLLCPVCKRVEVFKNQLYPKQFKAYKEVEKHCVAQGCDHCYYTGYKGRKAVYEVIPIDGILAEKIKNFQFDISDLLKDREIKTLAENAFEIFERGETTIDEIYPLLLNF